MSDLFLLSSAQMRRIKPFFPRSPHRVAPAHTDWLYHHLTVSGPEAQVAALPAGGCGRRGESGSSGSSAWGSVSDASASAAAVNTC